MAALHFHDFTTVGKSSQESNKQFLSLSLSHRLSLLSKHILLHYRPSLTLFLCHSLFPILPLFFFFFFFWLIHYILLTSLAARFPYLYIGFHLVFLPLLDSFLYQSMMVIEVRNVNGLLHCDAACIDMLIHIKRQQTLKEESPGNRLGLFIYLKIFIHSSYFNLLTVLHS